MPPCDVAVNVNSPGCRAKPRFFYAPDDIYHSQVMATLAADTNLDPAVDIVPLADFAVLAETMVGNAMRIANERVVAALTGELLGDTTTTTLAIRHDPQDALAGTRARGGVCVSGMWQWEVRVSVLLAPGTDLARVFAFVAGGGVDGVVDFGLNNCSLEDVFIQVSGRFFNGSA
ncbi:hypothetical protein BC828DRAFT_26078 [Blastocladiella britannica]|nr:hypothetical protein BC828DRAFT_26078 [Blastocladiella britannica]